jgi:hypothetical protein
MRKKGLRSHIPPQISSNKERSIEAPTGEFFWRDFQFSSQKHHYHYGSNKQTKQASGRTSKQGQVFNDAVNRRVCHILDRLCSKICRIRWPRSKTRTYAILKLRDFSFNFKKKVLLFLDLKWRKGRRGRFSFETGGICMYPIKQTPPSPPPHGPPNKTGKYPYWDDVASSDGREQNVVFSWTVVISWWRFPNAPPPGVPAGQGKVKRNNPYVTIMVCLTKCEKGPKKKTPFFL